MANEDRQLEVKQLRIREYKYDAASGIFEGYAAVFGNVDSDGDIIEKGAFKKFLARGWDRVKILALHNDEWLPIGKPIELYEDDVGLYIKGQISDTSLGRDVRQLMKDGVLDEMSIGYLALDYYNDSDRIRHLTEIELQEVSIVTWAANEMAKVMDVKTRLKNGSLTHEGLIAIAEQLEQTAARIRQQLQSSESEEPAAPPGVKSAACAVTLPAKIPTKSKYQTASRKKR